MQMILPVTVIERLPKEIYIRGNNFVPEFMSSRIIRQFQGTIL
jgi:hypothetical protein